MALIAFFFFTIFFCNISIITSQAIPKFTSILVFGDSTVDTGNNNHILTIAKGNHPPYGQDYPNHIPTGRFSNGKLVPDILAILLNLKKNGVPPYMQPDLPTNELLTGICFASGGTGYDELTSTISGAIPMRKQLDYFKEYLRKIRVLVGEIEAERIVNGALVIVSAGTNDFIFNFYDLPKRRLRFSLSKYQDFLLGKVQSFVKELYDLGCRNIIVNGLPPIGCLPIQMTAKSPLLRTCINKENFDAQIYNQKLEHLLLQLQAHLPGSKILYIDSYAFVSDLINNAQEYGFEETKRGCCGSGLVEAGPLCTRLSPVCSDPSQFIFFDSIHPTESTYYKATDYLLKQLLPKFEKF
ncbi:GDSL esterase/lipase At2g24560-like [Lycium barbarum]|uniref:GDSL esterase/lipase At2g24560-like n=1 Tax=Lycium barbarum TaxID=112863 RepID=UPI00293EFC69|nr:GDSL esterase/lipase At2g24560-like [Lycium barbarum]